MDNGESSYRRFLDGDDEGFTIVVRDYKDGLLLYLNNYVNNIYIAEDLMQETFVKIAVKRPNFKGKSSFKTWLYAIGRNAAIDYLRRSSKISVSSIHDMENYIKDESDLEKRYLKDERSIAIHKAMASLNPDYKQVLWLVYFEGLSNTEAALVVKKTNRQIEKLLYKAKQSLRSILEKEGFSFEEL
ncbi:MAG: RNA polymerase sigma factor [Clostridia bacterium]|nr:RNA polymerase sigma factor [Clostridia bacterium]